MSSHRRDKKENRAENKKERESVLLPIHLPFPRITLSSSPPPPRPSCSASGYNSPTRARRDQDPLLARTPAARNYSFPSQLSFVIPYVQIQFSV